jgi:hypothetical protein
MKRKTAMIPLLLLLVFSLPGSFVRAGDTNKTALLKIDGIT